MKITLRLMSITLRLLHDKSRIFFLTHTERKGELLLINAVFLIVFLNFFRKSDGITNIIVIFVPEIPNEAQ